MQEMLIGIILPQLALILVRGVLVWAAWRAASSRCGSCSRRSRRART
jgi:hypothetical protein